jgi:peptide/nickel transport system permease protein
VTPLDWLLPGFGHLRLGFRRQAVKYLLFMAAFGAIALFRWPRIRILPSQGTLEAWIALGLLALWWPFWAFAARRGLGRLLAPQKRESLSQWQVALGMLRKNGRAVWGLRLLGLVYAVAFLCPVLADYRPEETPANAAGAKLAPPFSTALVIGDRTRGEIYCREFRLEEETTVVAVGFEEGTEKRLRLSNLGEPRRGWHRPPTGTRTLGGKEIPFREERHLLGTDDLGKDLLSLLIYGSRISLSIGFIAMSIAVVIGAIVGTVAGYFGGWVDVALMRLVDILMAFPRLLMLLLIYVAYAAAKEQASIFVVVAVLGATGWMGVSRLVRAEVLSLRERDFAVAARALGLGGGRIMFRHLLPNAMAPLIVDATLRVGDTILTEAALSFLGMGVQKPTPSWGNIVEGGQEWLNEAWWIATLPGVAIVAVVACFNLVGDALRDALDPRLRT